MHYFLADQWAQAVEILHVPTWMSVSLPLKILWLLWWGKDSQLTGRAASQGWSCQTFYWSFQSACLWSQHRKHLSYSESVPFWKCRAVVGHWHLPQHLLVILSGGDAERKEVDVFHHYVHNFSKIFWKSSTKNSLMGSGLSCHPWHSPPLSCHLGRGTTCGDRDHLFQIYTSLSQHLLYCCCMPSPLVCVSGGVTPNRSSQSFFLSLWNNLTYTKSWA